MTGRETLAVQTEDLSRVYRSAQGNRSDVVALDNVSLNIQRGELFGLLGPNGAGKTTLVKILSTMLLPSSGSVTVLGQDVTRSTQSIRSQIGVVLGGERGLYTRLTARENLSYWGVLYGLHGSALRERVSYLLNVMGLLERAEDRVETFSRGMKQRIHLARGLVGSPLLLFLDEPTSGLDPAAASEFQTIVTNLQLEGVTILLTTHNMYEAEELCNRVAFINSGRIVLQDSPQALISVARSLEVVDVEFPYHVPAASLNAVRGVINTLISQREDVSSVVLQVEGKECLPSVYRELGLLGATNIVTRQPTLKDIYMHLANGAGMKI